MDSYVRNKNRKRTRTSRMCTAYGSGRRFEKLVPKVSSAEKELGIWGSVLREREFSSYTLFFFSRCIYFRKREHVLVWENEWGRGRGQRS